MASNSTLLLSPQRNVTFAVNYEVSIVDRYWQKGASSSTDRRNGDETVVDAVDTSATMATTQSSSGCENAENGVNMDDENNNSSSSLLMDMTMDESVQTPETTKALTSLSDEDTGSCKENKTKVVTIKSPITERASQRRSTREMKKREVPVERTRVRYDMELVPAVRRNRAFLDRFPLWSAPSDTREDNIKRFQFRQQSIIKEHQQKILAAQKQKQPLEEQKQPYLIEQGQAEKVQPVANRDNGWVVPGQQQLKKPPPGTSSLRSMVETDDASPELVDDEMFSPFEGDSSVIWVPKKRSEWEDSVLEMTAVCTSAAMRRHMKTRGKIPTNKPFQAPLSKEYIRDRIDIDDPLNGYQIRHRSGGWLQGFILWTNFTTWTHFFKWDSSHAMSGIPTMNTGASSSLVDADGSLALELEQQPRSGDPFGGGVVFEGVAEISLVGGLGCGEYVLRMALDSIRAKRLYKFVVLQATDSSKTFYERFGFVRVGAICRYERRDKDVGKPGVRPDTPIMGYRHWTHPNESDTSLQKHGGPSYMMCLKLPDDPEDVVIETPFLDEMMKLEVEDKPVIEQLGGTSTPYPKARKGSLDQYASIPPPDSQLSTKGSRRKPSRGRRAGTASPSTTTTTLAESVNAMGPPVLPSLRGSSDDTSMAQTMANALTTDQENNVAKVAGIKRGAETSGTAAALLTAGAKKRRLNATTEPANSTNAGTAALTNQEVKGLRRTPRDRTASTQSATDEPQSAILGVAPAEGQAARLEGKKALSAKKGETKSVVKRSTPRRNSGPAAVSSSAAVVAVTPAAVGADDSLDLAINRSGPMKQKVKSYPRDRVHFYNKVVRPKKGKKAENYFVLHYDEAKGTIRIIAMEPRGILSGKRAGRPRWQAVMDNFERDAKTVRCADYDIVKSFMVMKTPVVASEAWDVLDA